jgi:hypothetical protein
MRMNEGYLFVLFKVFVDVTVWSDALIGKKKVMLTNQ